jgi:hypothetical protein
VTNGIGFPHQIWPRFCSFIPAERYPAYFTGQRLYRVPEESMGRMGYHFKCDTYTLERALQLMNKERLTWPELTALAEGGDLCARHGAKILADGREGSYTARVIDALAVTSMNLIRRAKFQLENIPVSESEEAVRLSERISRTEQESQWLFCWADRLSHEGGQPRYNA